MVAYQGAHGLSTDTLLAQNAFAPAPDLTLLLDLPPEAGLERIRARGDRPNLFETADNLARCRRIFLQMALPSRRVIDAAQPPAAVLGQAWQAILAAAAAKLRQCDDPAGRAERLARLEAAATAA